MKFSLPSLLQKYFNNTTEEIGDSLYYQVLKQTKTNKQTNTVTILLERS